MTIDERTFLKEAVPSGPVFSDEFDFGGGRRFKFRLLDNLETMWAIVAAEVASLDMLKEQFKDEEIALDLLKNHAPNHDLQTWWEELHVLQAALCLPSGAPVVEGDARSRAAAMADMFDVAERHVLAQRYQDFVNEHDPVLFTDDEISGIVQAGKKNPTLSYWRQFAASTLRRCVATLAMELESSQRRINELEAEVAELRAEDPEGV